MPVGENSKEPILYMKNEDGAWVRLGKISEVGDIKEDPVGLEMDGMAVSFNKSMSMVLDAKIPMKTWLFLQGVPIINVVLCKDCKHKGNKDICPMARFDAIDDDDFCSRGEKK